MRQQLNEVRELISIQEREDSLRSLATLCCGSVEIISYRDHDHDRDVFLLEFKTARDALLVHNIMGCNQVSDSNLASIIISTLRVH